MVEFAKRGLKLKRERVIMDDFVIDGDMLSRTYYSTAEVADDAITAIRLNGTHPYRIGDDKERLFFGGVTWDEAIEMARHGWSEQLDTAMEIAESAVKLCEQEHETYTFAPVFDVAGGDVDVSRFLAGEPECMVDYPLTPTSKVGRVITLCVGLGMPSFTDADDALKRGYAIAGLALALARLGHSIEIWGDYTAKTRTSSYILRSRVLVKGVNDVLDPATVMFTISHPAFARACLMKGARRNTPQPWFDAMEMNGGCGYSIDPVRDLPDGTIYVPPIKHTDDLDPHSVLTGYLRELELLAS
jgi:hypothetical protein